MRNLFITALSAVFITGFPPILMAQEPVRVVEDGPGNRFYGQYEAVENHPDCARPDQVAFRVPLIADATEYEVFDPATNAIALVSRDTIITDQQCFVTHRRGTELMQVEVPCGSDREPSFRQRVEALEIEMQLRGDVTVCLSPMGASFVDSEWVVTVIDAGDAQAYRGNGVDEDAVSQAEFVKADQAAPSVAFSYVHEGFGDMAWPWRSRNHPLVLALDGTSGIRVSLKCIPVDISDGTPPLFLGFRASIAIVDAPTQACVGPDCPAFLERRVSLHTTLGKACIAQ